MSKTRVTFNDRDYVRSHGRKPARFGGANGGSGWAFLVPEWDISKVIWTRGCTRAEIAAEIIAATNPPAGHVVEAFIQP